jgi:DNA-binding CsgD family transcriptional regulator
MLKYQISRFREDADCDRVPVDGIFRPQRQGRPACAAFRVLDRLSVGIVFLDERARVLYLNPAAQSFESGGVLKLRDAAIGTWSPLHSQRLDKLIRAALCDAATGSMSVPRPCNGELLTILVSSLREPDRLGDFDEEDAAVSLFIVDPANQVCAQMQWLIDAYGLTPAQARVALAASSGRSVRKTANQFSLSPNTIKTHLKMIFAKTGTAGQTGLTRLITSIGFIGATGTASACAVEVRDPRSFASSRR